MKRPIKFKAQRVSDGEWVEGSLIQRIESTEIHDSVFTWVVDSNTICQFTGLTDKSGVEIYEGDIIERCHDLLIGNYNITLIEDGESKYVTDAFIEYVNGTFRLNKIGDDSKLYYGVLNFTQQCYNNEIEVIGNIHDKNTTSEI